ncbi:MAG: hypothetical protein EXR09_04125 [Acetobacteraceae bacterium]|nr:hypothetical protein [Acetobacteraceae bacterium]
MCERFDPLGRPEARLAGQVNVAALLDCLGANSPELAIHEAASLQAFIGQGPNRVVRTALDELGKVAPTSKQPRVAARLRKAKRIIALACAIADIGEL